MEPGTISRSLLSDQVYELILASILDGTRAPGSRVVESEIARQLGISQAPVREAVKRLVHAGLVESLPRRGSYVTEISLRELEISRTMRASIESEAARIAAAEAGDTEFATLEGIVGRMRAAVDAEDGATFRVLDLEFHRAVVGMTQRTVLARLWQTLEPTLVSQRAIGDPAFSGDRSQVVAWHVDLVEALRAGPDAAAAAFSAHASGSLGNGGQKR